MTSTRRRPPVRWTQSIASRNPSNRRRTSLRVAHVVTQAELIGHEFLRAADLCEVLPESVPGGPIQPGEVTALGRDQDYLYAAPSWPPPARRSRPLQRGLW